MICVDVSDSMKSGRCNGYPQLTPSEVAVGMALITWHVEKDCRIMAFGDHGLTLHDLTDSLRREMKISEAIKLIKKVKLIYLVKLFLVRLYSRLSNSKFKGKNFFVRIRERLGPFCYLVLLY